MAPSVDSELQRSVLLCIDDDEDVLECEKSFLESFGYTVLTAASGGKGLELASRHSVDVVIVDYFMQLHAGNERAPGCHGNETAQATSPNHHAFSDSGCPGGSVETGGRFHIQGQFGQRFVTHDRTIAPIPIDHSAFL